MLHPRPQPAHLLVLLGLMLPSILFTQPRSVAAQAESGCAPEVLVMPSQGAVLLGEAVEVSLLVRPGCPDGEDPLHLALVLDVSGEHPRELEGHLEEITRELVRTISFRDHPGDRLAIVAHFRAGAVLCELTDLQSRAMICTQRFPLDDRRTELGAGIEGARALLEAGRATGAATASEAMIVVTDGAVGPRCRELSSAVAGARAAGIRVATVAASQDAGTACLLDAASAPGLARVSGTAAQVADVVTQLFGRLRSPAITLAELAWPLPPEVELVEDGLSPAPSDMGADGRTPTWRSNFLPRTGLEMTLRVKPTRAGLRATGLEPTLTWSKSNGDEGVVRVPAPRAWVLAPRLLPPR